LISTIFDQDVERAVGKAHRLQTGPRTASSASGDGITKFEEPGVYGVSGEVHRVQMGINFPVSKVARRSNVVGLTEQNILAGRDGDHTTISYV
jgi:hypothetical protein